MKKYILIFTFLITCSSSYSQNIEEKSIFLEQIVEDIAENSEEEIDFSELFESLEFYYKNPINLNKCNREDLQNLHPEAGFSHIERNGKLISYLELQSISTFNVSTIKLLNPFIKITEPINTQNIFGDIQQYVLLRDERTLQEQKGYIEDELGDKYYLGSKNKSLFKYRLNNKYLQAGITAEKDKGETFLGDHQKYGYDFYSAHFPLTVLYQEYFVFRPCSSLPVQHPT